MKQWDQMRTVPKERLKVIQAGRMKGKSDINPQWRYEILTRIYGPCGFGWKFTIEKTWVTPEYLGEIAAFAQINLYVKLDGEWSEAIPANGGSMFVANESKGPHLSDECFKMAITDALGNAAKMLGVAADVYGGISESKYESKPNTDNNTENKPEDTREWLNKGEMLNQAIDYLKGGGSLATIEKKYRINKEIKANLLTVVNTIKP